MSSCRNPVAIVTGAGSGMGRATAKALSRAGFAVALAGRRADRLQETGTRLTTPWRAITTDVGVPGHVNALVDETLQTFGRIDVLVNGAGTLFPGTIAEHTPQQILQTFAVNAAGPAFAIARVWPTFQRQRSGCIVNISSSATQKKFGGLFAYTASKGALDMLTMCCAQEGRHCGVRAFAINPGFVETEMLRNFADETAVPKSRALSPLHVASLVVDCIQGRQNHRNGDTILISVDQPRGESRSLFVRLARRAQSAAGL